MRSQPDVGRSRALCGLALGFLLIGQVGAASPASAKAEQKAKAESKTESGAPAIRSEMHAAYASIEQLLPLTLDPKTWADPARRATIQKQLDQLARTSSAIEKHAAQRDQSFIMLSRSLSEELEDVKHRFALGQLEESRYLLMQSTSNCVTCHERLPSARDFPMGQRLGETMNLDELPVDERIHTRLVTRQFDAAMTDLETAMADPRERPSDLDFSGSLVDYLTVGIRVKQDPDRVARHLRTFAKRPDVPRYLRKHVDQWVSDLEQTKGALDSKTPLVAARRLVRRGTPDGETRPLARDTTVPDLVASSLLLRFISRDDVPAVQKAEAFYLLGVAESRGIDSPWIPQAGVHLEFAVRLAPEAPFADSAYDALEEYMYLNYGGVSGETALPIDITAKLDELRELLEAADAGAPQSAPE